MEILDIYAQALAEYRAKHYDAALQILDEFKKVACWSKAILLEAYIRRDQKLYVTEISILQKFFEVVNISQEKSLVADAYSVLGSACRMLGLSKNAVDFFVKSARLTEGQTEICSELSNAIFAASDIENFNAEDFEKLYAAY